MKFLRGVRIWLTMFPTAQFLAEQWFPTFSDFKAHQKRMKDVKDV